MGGGGAGSWGEEQCKASMEREIAKGLITIHRDLLIEYATRSHTKMDSMLIVVPLHTWNSVGMVSG